MSIVYIVEIVNSFGGVVPKTPISNMLSSQSGYYLLTNTEIMFTSRIYGFEFYASTAGSLVVSVCF